MDSGGGGIIFLAVLGIAVVIFIAYLGYLQAKKRREEMAAYAAAHGWRYVPEQPELVHRFQGTPFGRGDDREAKNVIYGQHDGRDFVSFDYSYETTSGTGDNRHTTTWHYSVLAMSMGAVLPPLEVEPENFLERVVGRITNADIELELEDFNRAFSVRCPDRKFASDVLHPRMMEFLLQHRQIAWRFERDSLIVVADDQRTTAQIDWALWFMDALTDQIPDFVWLRVRGES